MLSIKGTSHAKRYSSTRKYYVWDEGRKTSLFEKHLQVHGIHKCSSYPGLTVMGEFFDRNSLDKLPALSVLRKIHRPDLETRNLISYLEGKESQFKAFARDLGNGIDMGTLVVLQSNDYKTFLTDHKGNMLKLVRAARGKWDNLKSKGLKCNYDAYAEKPLKKEARLHLEGQFDKYAEILKPILEKSVLEVLHHSSVLERINPDIPYLPLYFAIFNSVLKRYLDTWTKKKTFLNKFGKPIVCKFVSVREQFFMEDDPTSLFTEKSGELTHRTDEAMDRLIAIWRRKLLQGQ